ncbi:MAG: hypothetical protein SF053_17370 [Bacteroidia bacterium]|nr:hypothetical protein [Bacteroidia bacterium]
MTGEAWQILTSPEAAAIIEAHLMTDPADFALRYRGNVIPAALLSTQLRNLQKSRRKLPAYFAARCILPSLALEQCSSEAAAALKVMSGERCLDLTLGLGVDSAHFSRHFREVTGLERDPELAAITQYNFGLMGVSAQVVTAEAGAWLAAYEGPVFDLIYADPARRDAAGGRLHDPAATSPDIRALYPLLRRHGRTLLVKLSPMFDIAEAARLVPDTEWVAVVSVDGEVKEVLVQALLQDASPGSPAVQVWIHRGGDVQRYSFPSLAASGMAPEAHNPLTGDIPFILEPDPAFYKARAVPALMRTLDPACGAWQSNPQGYIWATGATAAFPGRTFQVLHVMPWKPSAVKTWLRSQGIRRAEVAQRDFPFSTQDIRRQLGITEGGDVRLIAGRCGSGLWLFQVMPVTS